MRKCVDCLHCAVCDPKLQSIAGKYCPHYKQFVYEDTDSVQEDIPECTILWKNGETTYLKGRNALRIARNWLYHEEECLLVYTTGWIYLKPSTT